MAFTLLPELLQSEGSNFYRIDRKWQPKDLIPDPYRRNLLKDVQGRLNLLEGASEELKKLDRAPTYIKLLSRMRICVRRAQFAWRTDDLEFIKQVAKFFTDYGLVLQYLKIDQARGLFN